MTTRDFLFTEVKPQKYIRHVAFWIVLGMFWSSWASALFYDRSGFIDDFLTFNGGLLLGIGYTYFIIYFLFPKYATANRKTKFIQLFFAATILMYFIYVVYRLWVCGDIGKPLDELLLMSWYATMNFILLGPPVVCAMFLTCKMLKNYYLKMEEKQNLIQENTRAELQLLKAQVHPHFLFNTLNNIYSFSLNKSNQTGDLVLRLSHTLQYMIHDCQEPMVPLDKELEMITDYIALEKVRYGGRLNLQVNSSGAIENKTIAPLLMIPFIENSFKHGTSQMLQDPWIELDIQVKENLLLFKLRNSKPHVQQSKRSKGIGLNNVKKRLQLIYPDKHQLIISSTERDFTVEMQVVLEPVAMFTKPGFEERGSSSQVLRYA